MLALSNLKYKKQINPIVKNIFKNFQNKIRISKENLTIIKSPAYNKVTLTGLGENSIKNKTFYFGNLKNKNLTNK